MMRSFCTQGSIKGGHRFDQGRAEVRAKAGKDHISSPMGSDLMGFIEEREDLLAGLSVDMGSFELAVFFDALDLLDHL